MPGNYVHPSSDSAGVFSAVKGQHFVYAAINKWVLRTAQVTYICFVYNMSQTDFTFTPAPHLSMTGLSAVDKCECAAGLLR
jgi:hypothetical protein